MRCERLRTCPRTAASSGFCAPVGGRSSEIGPEIPQLVHMSWSVALQDTNYCLRMIWRRRRSRSALQAFGPKLRLVLTVTKCQLCKQGESRSRSALNVVGARSVSVPRADPRVALTVPLASTKTLLGHILACNVPRIATERGFTLKDVVVRPVFTDPMGTVRFVPRTTTVQGAVKSCRALKVGFQPVGASC